MKDLEKLIKDKAVLSYPEKIKKTKKIVRKEIKIVRIDRMNKRLTKKLGVSAMPHDTINIVMNGEVNNYDCTWADVTVLIHYMQRIVEPVVKLTTKEDVFKFLDTTSNTIWDEDYSGSLLKDKTKEFDQDRIMDKYLQEIGYNTRVVAFFTNKSDFREDIKLFT